MKRVLLTVALCVAASASFAQKKVVNEAQSIAKGSNADFGEARTLIKGALENPETKDDAKTWYVAGFIEDQQFNAERAKQILGQQPNEPVMYEALYGILPYFQKAYELDQLPNEKGKVKPKYTKDIKSILSANHVYLFNGGAYYFDKQEYKKAYDFFNQYVEISELPMFAGTQTAEKDSTFMTVQFYAAAAASLAKDSRLAIAALERAKNTPYRQYDVYQYLCYEYGEARTAQDSVMLEKTFEECLKSDTYAELFILEWEGKIAGYGLIAKTFSQEAGGMVYWLEELYILEEYRSKGLGSEYFRYMEEHKEEGVTRFRLEVEKENERAWKLYKRQGYDWLEYDQMIKEFC